VSAVSWSAVFAGATAAAALTLVLCVLGFGLGLSTVSPWTQATSGHAVGLTAFAWIAFTQLGASAFGGYLAGRLRVRWASLHGDEVYFRDTAHGFLAWAIASLAMLAVLGTAVDATLGIAAKAASAAGTSLATMAVNESSDATLAGYYGDALFRRDAAHPGPAAPDTTRIEAARIVATDLKKGSLPDEDRRYLGAVIAQQTGVDPAEGEKRAADTFQRLQADIDKAKQTADDARKAAAHASLWMFVALMLGAFVASFTAIYGGRRRDLFD
jgi:hypothetical protein